MVKEMTAVARSSRTKTRSTRIRLRMFAAYARLAQTVRPVTLSRHRQICAPDSGRCRRFDPATSMAHSDARGTHFQRADPTNHGCLRGDARARWLQRGKPPLGGLLMVRARPDFEQDAAEVLPPASRSDHGVVRPRSTWPHAAGVPTPCLGSMPPLPDLHTVSTGLGRARTAGTGHTDPCLPNSWRPPRRGPVHLLRHPVHPHGLALDQGARRLEGRRLPTVEMTRHAPPPITR
jgi:hypothetical protein